jgi:hypothetical protein
MRYGVGRRPVVVRSALDGLALTGVVEAGAGAFQTAPAPVRKSVCVVLAGLCLPQAAAQVVSRKQNQRVQTSTLSRALELPYHQKCYS